MDDSSDIWLVNPHSKSNCCNNYLQVGEKKKVEYKMKISISVLFSSNKLEEWNNKEIVFYWLI